MKKYIFGLLIGAIVISGAIYSYHNLNTNKKVTSLQIDASYIGFDLGDLTTQADLIVQGKIVDVSSPQWNNKNNEKPDPMTGKDMIVQDHTLQIDQVLKGQALPNDKIRIRTLGGKVRDFSITNNGQPVFTNGDNVIVFLTHDNSLRYNPQKSTDYWVVLGAMQGDFTADHGIFKNVHGERTEAALKAEIEKFIRSPKVYVPVKSAL